MKFTQIHPKNTAIDKIPSCEGNYIVVLIDESILPTDKINIEPNFSMFNNHRVIYTGISTDLRKRDIDNHLNGTAGKSTLRKSLGVLFGYQLIPRDKNPKSTKTTFKDDDEAKLSSWMKNNLLFYHCANNKSEVNEQVLIDTYDPPLNLDKSQVSKDSKNKEFRDAVSALRSSKNMKR